MFQGQKQRGKGERNIFSATEFCMRQGIRSGGEHICQDLLISKNNYCKLFKLHLIFLEKINICIQNFQTLSSFPISHDSFPIILISYTFSFSVLFPQTLTSEFLIVLPLSFLSLFPFLLLWFVIHLYHKTKVIT